jgi:riboflavin synthase
VFTGIVEELGTVLASERDRSEGVRLVVAAAESAHASLGESISVNGCCLTVSALAAGQFAFDLLEETLRRTNLGALAQGSRVNLERALLANGRLGGHFVQGHIDCTAAVLEFEKVGADHRLELELPAEFARYVVEKGSIAINGISLTVAEVKESSLVVWIIPHTTAVTNLQTVRPGDRVNLEFDLLAKYLERLTQKPGESAG